MTGRTSIPRSVPQASETARAGRRGRLAGAAAALLGAGFLALLPATAASAHDYLVASNPAADSTQTTPLKKVVLTFDDRVLDLSGDGSSNVVEVTDPAQRHFESGCAVVADDEVSVPVALGDTGKYTVTWQIVSADGHTVSNSIAFDYVRPADTAAATGKATRPLCGEQRLRKPAPAGSAAATAAPGQASSNATGGTGGDVALAVGIGGGIIAAGLIVVVVVLRSNRPRSAPPEGDD